MKGRRINRTHKLAILLGGMWMLLISFATAQRFVPTAETRAMHVVADLNGTWLDSEFHFVTVPTWDPQSQSETLIRKFNFKPPESEESLYLLLEGVAWNATVTLNGKMLTLIEDPFTPTLLKIDPQWLDREGNELQVECYSEGPSQLYYPEKFTGIFRPVWLLAGEISPATSTVLVPNEKVLMVAPWNDPLGPVDDTLALGAMLDEIKSSGAGAISFCFPPSALLQEMLKVRQIAVSGPPDPWDECAFYNLYPAQRAQFPLAAPFWVLKGIHSPAFGHYYSVRQMSALTLRNPDHIAIFLFLALPVLFLALLRMLSEKIYDSLPLFLTKPKIFVEMIHSSNFMGQWEIWFMNLFRMIVIAIWISLGLYYLSLTHNFNSVNLISEESILFRVITTFDLSLYNFFGVAMVYILALNLFKHAFLYFCSQIFRQQGLSNGVVGLDIFSSFPMNLFMLIPAVFLFFTDAGWQVIPETAMIIFFVFFVIRRVVVIFQGLGRVYKLSVSAKFLYICAFDFLPWVILF